MATVNRTIESARDRTMAARLVENRPIPFTLTLTDGKHRSTAQNRLQRKWLQEISEQLRDRKPEEIRGYCKLHFGVPILRDENEAFRERYDAVIKPMSYERKLAIMQEPLSLPVTSIMTTRQKTAYLDAIYTHFTKQGIVLTTPEDGTLHSADEADNAESGERQTETTKAANSSQSAQPASAYARATGGW